MPLTKAQKKFCKITITPLEDLWTDPLNSSYPIGSISEVAPELLKLLKRTYTMGPAIGVPVDKALLRKLKAQRQAEYELELEGSIEAGCWSEAIRDDVHYFDGRP